MKDKLKLSCSVLKSDLTEDSTAKLLYITNFNKSLEVLNWLVAKGRIFCSEAHCESKNPLQRETLFYMQVGQ